MNQVVCHVRQFPVMRNDNDGNALPVHFLEKMEDPSSCCRVQISCRFVRKDDLRFIDKGPAYGNPLHFSSTQLRRQVPRPVL